MFPARTVVFLLFLVSILTQDAVGSSLVGTKVCDNSCHVTICRFTLFHTPSSDGLGFVRFREEIEDSSLLIQALNAVLHPEGCAALICPQEQAAELQNALTEQHWKVHQCEGNVGGVPVQFLYAERSS